jgi:exodeoxyribonuclease VII small subunit
MSDDPKTTDPKTTDAEVEPDMAHWDTRIAVETLDPEAIAALPFESAYGALDEAVRRLESGELDLEQSIILYDRGVALARRCGTLLEAAELRVKQVDTDGAVSGDVVL